MLYRVATLEDCAVLTSLRMKMRAERDPGFCKEDLIEITHAFFQAYWIFVMLMYMYTVPQQRCLGVSIGMLAFVLAYAQRYSLGRIMLNASPMGKPLYEGFGFQLIPNEYGMNLQKQK